MSGARGRGSRFATGDCPDCGERCAADDRSLDAHRMWATRHANATGHTAHVTTIRTYEATTQPRTPAGSTVTNQPRARSRQAPRRSRRAAGPLGGPQDAAGGSDD